MNWTKQENAGSGPDWYKHAKKKSFLFHSMWTICWLPVRQTPLHAVRSSIVKRYLCFFTSDTQADRTAPFLNILLLGPFAKLRKATMASSSLCVFKSVSNRRILTKFDKYISKIVQNIQVSLKSNMSKEHFTWKPMHNYVNISLNSSWNEKRFKQKL